jgi:hypothetical protein
MSSLPFLERPAVTAAEAAVHCNVSRPTITHWMNSDWLRPIGRFGRALLFRPADVLKADVTARSDAQRSRRRKAIDGTGA